MTQFVVSALKTARDVLSDPARWCKDNYALGPDMPDGLPEQMCVVGGLCSVLEQHGIDPCSSEAQVALSYLKKALPPNGWGDSVPAFNDSDETVHAHVVDLYHRAVSLAEQDALT